MTTDVATAEPDTTLEEIAVMMRDLDTGAIPVVEHGELLGIVTDRDIVVRCLAEGKDPTEVTVDEVISEELETVEPDDDIEEASRLMAQKQIRRLPVCEDGRLVGVISLGDIAVKHSEEIAGDTLESVSQGVKQKRAGSQRGAREKAHEIAGRVETKVRGGPKAVERAGERQGRHQAISNQGGGKERQRQQRVVPIREEGKPASRRKAS
jgi:signal-transduction protein with cAMP-binding, CBS, and nucleotidyltransferase domain